MPSRKSLASHPKERRVYGRRQSRPLNKSRQEAVDTLLPVLSIPESLLTEQQDLDPETLFSEAKPQIHLEIGFGSGERLAEDMRRNPGINFLAAEPYIDGMAAFLKEIKDEPHDHVRVLMDDAMLLCNSLTDQSLDRIYVLNPDPWHKKRHHKRRIINPENLDCLARILKPGGTLIMSTDVPDLTEWMVTHAARHPHFTWTANSAHDWRAPPENWIHTRYETKGAKGAKKMSYLIFTKNPCQSSGKGI